MVFISADGTNIVQPVGDSSTHATPEEDRESAGEASGDSELAPLPSWRLTSKGLAGSTTLASPRLNIKHAVGRVGFGVGSKTSLGGGGGFSMTQIVGIMKQAADEGADSGEPRARGSGGAAGEDASGAGASSGGECNGGGDGTAQSSGQKAGGEDPHRILFAENVDGTLGAASRAGERGADGGDGGDSDGAYGSVGRDSVYTPSPMELRLAQARARAARYNQPNTAGDGATRRETLSAVNARSWITSANGAGRGRGLRSGGSGSGGDGRGEAMPTTARGRLQSEHSGNPQAWQWADRQSPPRSVRRPRDAALSAPCGVEALLLEDEAEEEEGGGGFGPIERTLRGTKLGRATSRSLEPMLRGYLPTPLYPVTARPNRPPAAVPPSSHSVFACDPSLHLGRYTLPTPVNLSAHAVRLHAVRMERVPPTPAATRRLLLEGQLSWREALNQGRRVAAHLAPLASART